MNIAISNAESAERLRHFRIRMRLCWCWIAIATVTCTTQSDMARDVTGPVLLVGVGLLLSCTLVLSIACAWGQAVSYFVGTAVLYRPCSYALLKLARSAQLAMELAMLCVLAHILTMLFLR